MLFTISWRNIWRSKTRSIDDIRAIILGVWALIFMISFSTGMIKSYVSNAIQNEISHVQVHHSEFMEDKESKFYMTDSKEKLQFIATMEGIQSATSRTIANGMLTSSKGARGIMIRAVEPETEAAVTKINEKIVEGEYFTEGKRNQLLVSRRIADKLKVKLRSKVVLTFQDLEGEITAAAFRISGVFESGNTPFDEMNVFVTKDNMNQLIGQSDISHEIAIFLDDPATLDATKAKLQAQYPDLSVQTYREISPDVQLYESQIQTSATIFIVIIMLALVFGIINTMLMAVLERFRELGMLMAVGMNKIRVFTMIVLETIMLAAVAVVPGMLLGFITVEYFNKNGIDLSAFSKGINQFGMSEIIYTDLDPGFYIQLAVAVCITAVIGAIYPAFKAIRLRPVEAMRKI